MDDVHDGDTLRPPNNEDEEQEAEKKDLDSGPQHRRHGGRLTQFWMLSQEPNATRESKPRFLRIPR
jgi:hypothetical protein